MMTPETNHNICRIGIFMIWLILLTPIYTAEALEIQFNPDSDITVTDVTANINWRTDDESRGAVRYGVDTEELEVVRSDTPATEHSIEITGIAYDAAFQFFIEATNATGGTARSPVDGGDYHTFHTEPRRDREPPHAVKGLAAPTITRDSITLTWDSDSRDEDIDHYMVFKDGSTLNANVKQKSYTAAGLNFSTEFEFKVCAVDVAGNNGPNTTVRATTRSESFQSLIITDFNAEVTGTNIYATWNTNLASHTRIKYGQNPLLLDQKKEEPTMVTSHNMTLTDLAENSDFTIMAESCDVEGNCGNSTAITITTSETIALALSVDGMDCDPQTSSFSNDYRLDIKGSAAPGADVTVYVNSVKKRFKRMTSTGVFNFAGVDLDPSSDRTDIRITASDKSSADIECLETVLIDNMPPEIHFDNATENLAFALQQNAQIVGNLTDENPVTVYLYLQSVDDTIPPPAPGNVTNTSLTSSSITIGWSPYGDEVTDLYSYLVYRSDVPDGPIASVEKTATSFSDENVSSATTYTYQVSAVDNAGNEGSKSSSFSVTTDAGEAVAQPRSKIVPENPSLKLTKSYTPNNSTIQFTESVGPLFEGENTVRMVFIDAAGNEVEETFTLRYDSEPPTIISPTSAEISGLYSPTYMSELLIRGQINKPTGEVWVWVNPDTASFNIDSLTQPSSTSGSFDSSTFEKPAAKFAVGANGTFEAEIELSTSIGASIAGTFTGDTQAGSTESSAAVSVSGPSTSGAADQNRIVMIAFDQYGRPSQPVEGTIEYTPCGSVYYWSVNIESGGNVINTRELLEGVAAYGFSYDLEWVGGGNAALARAQNVRVRKATVGAREAEKYDFDWVAGEPRVLTRRGNATSGFVMINFATQDPEGETYLEKEQNLSDNRVGECWPDVNGHGPGCIQLLLEMEIDSDPGPFREQYGSSATGVAPVGAPAIMTQKQCMLVQIMLDERIDFASSDSVKVLLNTSLKVINATLEFINLIETPIKYATQITLGLCLVSHLSKFIIDALESYYCKWNSALRQLNSIEGAIGALAQVSQGSIEKIAGMHSDAAGDAGACKIEFPTTTPDQEERNSDAQSACIQCADWKGKANWVRDKWHLFCDRVMCPSVPSLQHYISQSQTGGRAAVWRPGDVAGAAADAAQTQRSNTPCDVGHKMNVACMCGTGDDASECTTDQVCIGGSCVAFPTDDCPDSGSYTGEGTCACGTDVACQTDQICINNRCQGEVATPTGSAITGFASSNLITGLVMCGTPPNECAAGQSCTNGRCTPTTSAAATSSASGTRTNPIYDRVLPYAKDDWKRADIKAAKYSDCGFATVGRSSLNKMWDFYNAHKKDETGEKCEEGHTPQPACCPFEYMSEWGWGMMYSNEVKMSYCLADPGAEECGMGQTIQKGVTGICQPQGSAPRAIPVILDQLKWKNNYPVNNDARVNDNVAYLVDIDESGTAKTVRRGYFSKSEVRETVGSVDADTGRVEISTGSYFIPEPGTENIDMASWFPERDNADLGQDSDMYEKGLKSFGDDIKAKLTSTPQPDIEFRSSTRSALGDANHKGGAIEDWYRQIYGLLGDPGRQYLAQPAGSFMQSILTLCLSGILSWLVQFKNMLLLLQQCFQTILVTGDGSSGQCQALISQYICDLIQEAISCITTRLGAGGSSQVGVGGVGGFFSAISDASRTATEEAQSRYGDRNLFGTTFAAENVLHDACIFMFTGEWPTDFGALFDSAAYLPINSSGLVFPVTRRWQAYDPSTGYSRYVYRIAYSFFAGADIHYDLKLGCSGQGLQCDTETGLCDCAHGDLATYQSKRRIVELNIPRHGSGNCPENGDMTQGQYCTDEILFVAEGQPLRYDKVVLDYRPTQQMGGASAMGAAGSGFGGTMADASAVTGRVEGSIREIGAPPVGLCNFDIGQLAFRCGVEVPANGFARLLSVELVNAPAPGQIGNTGAGTQYGQQSYATSSFGSQAGAGGGTAYGSASTGSGTAYSAGYSNTPVNLIPYGIGDSIIARARVQQELPPNSASCSGDCDFTKYLLVEVYNGASTQGTARIYPTGTQQVGERLNSAGIKDLMLLDSVALPAHAAASNEPFVIKREHFGLRPAGNSGARRVMGNMTSFITGQIQVAGDVVEGLAINVSYVPSSRSFNYVPGRVETIQQRRIFISEGGSQSCTPESRLPETLPSGQNHEISCGGFTFALNSARIRQSDESIRLPASSIVFNLPQRTASGGAETCPQEPTRWTMVVEIRDSVSIGGAGYQMAQGPSVDFDTGQVQRREIPFMVVCRDSGASDPTTASIEQLVRRSATVRAEHTSNNRAFGMWADENSMTSSESITVSDFEWVAPGDHSRGFRLNIDSNSAYGVLNIDVGAIGLIPDQFMQVQKGETTILDRCGGAPCIESIGDTNNRVIRIRLQTGDPIFTFSGFEIVGGLASITGDEEIVLTTTNRFHPGQDNPILGVSANMPAGGMVTVRNYVENDDGVELWFNTTPASFIDPIAFGIVVSSRGFDASDAQVSVAGVTLQECWEMNADIQNIFSQGGRTCPLDREPTEAERPCQ